jgi:hypothetical protein
MWYREFDGKKPHVQYPGVMQMLGKLPSEAIL